ncbi:MAG: cbb3-type cytochrome c oxidase subunit 3 [Candidatus Nitrospinota bacterium M3_3B_026]
MNDAIEAASVYQRMTATDWLGLSVTVVVFFLMAGVYVYIMIPSVRERLEAQKRSILEEDSLDKEV